MDDKYNLEEIRRRLYNLVHTTGALYMHLAQLPKLVYVTPVPENVEDVTPECIATLLNKKDFDIENTLLKIREYIRTYQDLLKDYHSLYYMQFSEFSTYSKYDTNTTTDMGHDDYFYTRDNGYDNHSSYFNDTVKNVLHMSQKLRDDVRTLFVGNNYDVKLDLVQNIVSPDTLVINAHGIEEIQVPFLPSVHRVKVLNRSSIPILLDNYTETLTELALFLTSDQVSESDARLIENCPMLEAISLEAFNSDVCYIMAECLHNRREYGFNTIKSFRIFSTLDTKEDVIALLQELRHHPLEVLVLNLNCIHKHPDLIDHITDLVGSLDSLRTLCISEYGVDTLDLMRVLNGKVDKVTDIFIHGRYIPGSDAEISLEVLEMPSVKVVEIAAYSNTKQVHNYLMRNRKRDTSFYDPFSLMNLLPNTKTIDNTSPQGDTSMYREIDDNLRDLISIVYNDPDDEDDSYERPDSLQQDPALHRDRIMQALYDENNVE